MDTVPPHAENGNIPNASGIYKITCTVTKKIYIGSSANLLYRKYKHYGALMRNKHSNPHLQRAWNKYGEASFTFEVLELVLPVSLTAREQYWFEKLKPFGRRGFNILHEAGSPLGWKHTPESREHLRQAHLGKKKSPEHIEKMRINASGKKQSPEAREKLRQANLGRKQSPESIEKTRQALIGRKKTPEHIEKMRQANLGKKHSPEARAKMSQSQLGRKHTPETIEKMRQVQRDRAHTPEARAKISASKLGKPAPNRDVKRTPEQIENMRRARWRERKE